jgi:4-amino-4-deoxy-L-arabinose transferase-like glycosyltransferase
MKSNRHGTFNLPGAFWTILVLSFLLRGTWLIYARPVPVLDFRDYRVLAERLVSEHGYLNRDHQPTAFRLPGYPSFLSLLMLLGGNNLWLGLGAVILSTSICIPVYYFSRIVSGGRDDVALFGAAVTAFYPPFIFYSPVLASEPLEAALVLWVFVLLLIKKKLSITRAAAAGILMAGACLTRGSSLLFFPVAVLAIFAVTKNRGGKQIVRGLVFFAAAVIPLAAWWTRNRIMVGPGVGLSTQGGINFYYAHNPDNYGWRACLGSTSPLWKLKGEVEMSREGYRRGLEYLANHPGHILDNIKISSRLLYSTPDYCWNFSTKSEQKGEKGGSLNRQLAFLPWARNLTIAAHAFFFSLAVLSILRWRVMPKWGIVLILLLLAAHWVFYGLIFHGARRYGYIIYLFLAPLSALTLATMTSPSEHNEDR